ncbi:Putative sodium-coupled neutral amino acid transporter 11 [Seminavis robusta]|uniref:Sodium-coupled neutral amino acid transporter 11 n=1 Tax=Seminavis robusta TaxID=568900 RepID=A0A9N8EA84_9STRA|nr:Putative sodium-coupled neutral amino acid transporter 11 [Seminavis robusta]|eukprot:Sro719_g192320.1 Putative sodium-coupled neutral amino acid transporter 11 (492) ;mRNA; f:19798-21461
MRQFSLLNLLLLLSAASLVASKHATSAGWLKPSSPIHQLDESTQRAIFAVSGGAAKATPKKAKKSGGKAPAISNPDGASIPNEIFNLVKAIVGVGVLSLPAGIAAFADNKSAFLPAAIMIGVIGVLSGYGFAIIGKVCAYTGATSYREAWAESIGPKTSWIPAWSATLKTSLACLAFSMVLGDTFATLLKQPRTPTLIGVTCLVLLPLCLMKNLKSLAPFSLLGVMGMAYTALAMTVRWLDGSYAMTQGAEGMVASGNLVADVAENLRPKFGSVGGFESVLNPSSLILLCMLSTAYMAHFNAPKFYLELKDNTIPRFNTVVSWSFGISILLMGYITMTGFLTFGKSSQGFILSNYSVNDLWISGSRIAVAISLVFSYPLAFVGMRDGIVDLVNVPTEKRTNSFLNGLTVAMLTTLTALACVLTDVSFVLSFGGATLGNALTYLYPALMYAAINKKQGRKEDLAVLIAQASAVLGVVMGAIGANMALKMLKN